MTDRQIWAFAALAIIFLAFALLMQPAARKLDGRQKYRRERIPGADADPDANKRPSMTSLQIALAALLGHTAMSGLSETDGVDGGESSDGGGGADASDGGGGGE